MLNALSCYVVLLSTWVLEKSNKLLSEPWEKRTQQTFSTDLVEVVWTAGREEKVIRTSNLWSLEASLELPWSCDLLLILRCRTWMRREKTGQGNCQFIQFSSVQFRCSVMSDSLRPHEPQHARPPCLSPTPGAYPNSCPLSWWCHPTISSSAVPFSSYLQSFPTSGSFPISQFFTSGGQSIRVSASSSALPMNIQDWFPIDELVGSPCSPSDSQESSPTPQFKIINFSALSFLYSPTLISIHDYWKNHSFD